MFSKILLPITTYPDATPESGLARVADLVATLRARLTALVLEVDIPPIINPVTDLLVGFESEALAAERQSRERGVAIGRQLKWTCERIGLPLTIETLKARRPLGELVATQARSFDLSVLICDPESPDQALFQEDVLFGSGGPVVMMPPHDAPSHIETVAVAWDGGRTAARAAHDAMPILRQAGSVLLLTCTQDKPIDHKSIDGALDLLGAYGIGAKHVPVALGEDSIGTALQNAALAHDAGLLVMGAYGHSRLSEFILGGATASVLRSPRLPLCMSH